MEENLSLDVIWFGHVYNLLNQWLLMEGTTDSRAILTGYTMWPIYPSYRQGIPCDQSTLRTDWVYHVTNLPFILNRYTMWPIYPSYWLGIPCDQSTLHTNRGYHLTNLPFIPTGDTMWPIYPSYWLGIPCDQSTHHTDRGYHVTNLPFILTGDTMWSIYPSHQLGIPCDQSTLHTNWGYHVTNLPSYQLGIPCDQSTLHTDRGYHVTNLPFIPTGDTMWPIYPSYQLGIPCNQSTLLTNSTYRELDTDKVANKLKLPSLLAAWPLWTFHTKSHNMKAFVIQSHSWSPFLPLTCLYAKNELLWVSEWPSGLFSWEKTPSRLPMQITWPWPQVARFCHGLITIRQKKMWT